MSLVLSSVELVEFLESIGLRQGNKVQQQVDVPDWIWQDQTYQIGCLLGLMDTDGCFYQHLYRVNGQTYAYPKLCLTNYSRPLLRSAKRMFESLGLFPTIHKDGHRLYLHDVTNVTRYMWIVGTHNRHHQVRYLNSSQLIGKQPLLGEVAETGRLQLTANELGGQKLPPGFKSRPLRLLLEQ